MEKSYMFERLEKWRKNGGHINPRYDLMYADIQKMIENKLDVFHIFFYTFAYGYLQGTKAAKAEMKKKAKNIR